MDANWAVGNRYGYTPSEVEVHTPENSNRQGFGTGNLLSQRYLIDILSSAIAISVLERFCPFVLVSSWALR